MKVLKPAIELVGVEALVDVAETKRAITEGGAEARGEDVEVLLAKGAREDARGIVRDIV
jgi:hypothetical protein